jgi:hypothetical protein
MMCRQKYEDLRNSNRKFNTSYETNLEPKQSIVNVNIFIFYSNHPIYSHHTSRLNGKSEVSDNRYVLCSIQIRKCQIRVKAYIE